MDPGRRRNCAVRGRTRRRPGFLRGWTARNGPERLTDDLADAPGNSDGGRNTGKSDGRPIWLVHTHADSHRASTDTLPIPIPNPDGEPDTNADTDAHADTGGWFPHRYWKPDRDGNSNAELDSDADRERERNPDSVGDVVTPNIPPTPE